MKHTKTLLFAGLVLISAFAKAQTSLDNEILACANSLIVLKFLNSPATFCKLLYTTTNVAIRTIAESIDKEYIFFRKVT